MYKIINLFFLILILLFFFNIYNYYSSNKNIKNINLTRSNIEEILKNKTSNLPVLENDTNNICSFMDNLYPFMLIIIAFFFIPFLINSKNFSFYYVLCIQKMKN